MTTPLAIVVDTREQRGYTFDDSVESGLATVTRACLPAGDYSLVGHETRVAIERKNLNDLVSTILFARERFTAELDKLDSYQDAAIVVEASMADITSQKYTSGAKWQSVMAAIFSIQSQYRIPVIFAGDRTHASIAVRGMLWAYARKVGI